MTVIHMTFFFVSEIKLLIFRNKGTSKIEGADIREGKKHTCKESKR